MLRTVTRRQVGTFGVILFVGLAVLLIAVRNGTAQANREAKPRYRAEVVASTVAGESRAAASLEALLNRRAEDGYEIFDIDRDATGNTLVVFQLASK